MPSNSPLAKDLPNPGAYVRVWKYLTAAQRGRPEALGWLWGTYGTAAEHLRHFDDALQRRINLRGGILPASARAFDRGAAYMRDQRRLHDYLQHRVVHPGSGFETAVCRRRFPFVHQRMRAYAEDE